MANETPGYDPNSLSVSYAPTGVDLANVSEQDLIEANQNNLKFENEGNASGAALDDSIQSPQLPVAPRDPGQDQLAALRETDQKNEKLKSLDQAIRHYAKLAEQKKLENLNKYQKQTAGQAGLQCVKRLATKVAVGTIVGGALAGPAGALAGAAGGVGSEAANMAARGIHQLVNKFRKEVPEEEARVELEQAYKDRYEKLGQISLAAREALQLPSGQKIEYEGEQLTADEMRLKFLEFVTNMQDQESEENKELARKEKQLKELTRGWRYFEGAASIAGGLMTGHAVSEGLRHLIRDRIAQAGTNLHLGGIGQLTKYGTDGALQNFQAMGHNVHEVGGQVVFDYHVAGEVNAIKEALTHAPKWLSHSFNSDTLSAGYHEMGGVVTQFNQFVQEGVGATIRNLTISSGVAAYIGDKIGNFSRRNRNESGLQNIAKGNEKYKEVLGVSSADASALEPSSGGVGGGSETVQAGLGSAQEVVKLPDGREIIKGATYQATQDFGQEGRVILPENSLVKVKDVDLSKGDVTIEYLTPGLQNHGTILDAQSFFSGFVITGENSPSASASEGSADNEVNTQGENAEAGEGAKTQDGTEQKSNAEEELKESESLSAEPSSIEKLKEYFEIGQDWYINSKPKDKFSVQTAKLEDGKYVLQSPNEVDLDQMQTQMVSIEGLPGKENGLRNDQIAIKVYHDKGKTNPMGDYVIGIPELVKFFSPHNTPESEQESFEAWAEKVETGDIKDFGFLSEQIGKAEEEKDIESSEVAPEETKRDLQLEREKAENTGESSEQNAIPSDLIEPAQNLLNNKMRELEITDQRLRELTQQEDSEQNNLEIEKNKGRFKKLLGEEWTPDFDLVSLKKQLEESSAVETKPEEIALEKATPVEDLPGEPTEQITITDAISGKNLILAAGQKWRGGKDSHFKNCEITSVKRESDGITVISKEDSQKYSEEELLNRFRTNGDSDQSKLKLVESFENGLIVFNNKDQKITIKPENKFEIMGKVFEIKSIDSFDQGKKARVVFFGSKELPKVKTSEEWKKIFSRGKII